MHVPFHAIVEIGIIGQTSSAYFPNFPVGEVVRYVLPVVVSVFDLLHGRRFQPWPQEWYIIWAVAGLISLCRCMCACEEMAPPIYTVRTPRPQLLSQL